MTATQTNSFPNVAPPPGAAVVDDWQSGPPPYRIVLGRKRSVGDAAVWTSVGWGYPETYLACVERFASAKGSEDATFASWVTARLLRLWSWSARCGINCTR
jgi:hypothetical protein